LSLPAEPVITAARAGAAKRARRMAVSAIIEISLRVCQNVTMDLCIERPFCEPGFGVLVVPLSAYLPYPSASKWSDPLQ
jgi:hypothetical protein